MNMEDIHYNKYIKYKTKYLRLKELSGGNNCEIIESGIPILHTYQFLDNAVIVEKLSDGSFKTFHYKPQKKRNDIMSTADKRNSDLLEQINNRYESLKKILNFLIDKYKSSWAWGSKTKRTNFESILKYLDDSKNIYITFRNSINIFTYNNSDKEKYYNNYISKKNELQLKIKEIETNIKNIFINIKNNSSENDFINIKITENINDSDFLKYNNKGICSLQNIIIYYFNKFKENIELTIPLFTLPQ